MKNQPQTNFGMSSKLRRGGTSRPKRFVVESGAAKSKRKESVAFCWLKTTRSHGSRAAATAADHNAPPAQCGGFRSSESMDAIQCNWRTLRKYSPSDCFAVWSLWPRWINQSPRDGFLRLGIWPVSVGPTLCQELGQSSEAFQRGEFLLLERDTRRRPALR